LLRWQAVAAGRFAKTSAEHRVGSSRDDPIAPRTKFVKIEFFSGHTATRFEIIRADSF